MQLRIPLQAWVPPERYRQAALHCAFAIPHNYKTADDGCHYLARALGRIPFSELNPVERDPSKGWAAVVLFRKRFDSLFKRRLDSALRGVGLDKDSLFLSYS